MGESRGIGAAGVRTSTQKPSQLSLFCKVLLPLLSLHNLSHLCYQLLPSLLTSWFGQPPATSCTTGPLLAGWVSIKWRGLTPHLHHKQGCISIKWRGLTPHLHHNTVALWERARELEQQGSEPVLRSHLSSHSSAKFYFLCYPFTFLLPSLLTSWFGQPPATSCHNMPRLGPCCQGGSI